MSIRDSIRDEQQSRDIPSGFLTSSLSRSSGKTVISMGLAAALHGEGRSPQCFKKGPDYIDPIWLARASQRPCFNLDPVLQSAAELDATFEHERRGASMVLVEGSQGLHDGLSDDFSDSNAGLASRLGLPVLLVIDATGMNRTIAALVNGLVEFDANVAFTGVILNRVKSSRHEQKLRRAIEDYTPLQVLGTMPSCPSLHIEQRELGLVPAHAHTHGAVDLKIEKIARQVRSSCDIAAIAGEPSNAADCDDLQSETVTVVSEKEVDVKVTRKPTYKVAVARDEAFQFYYEDDLARLATRGVELVDVSPMHDSFPKDLDGIIIGGGFPERFAKELAANKRFRDDLRQSVNAGLAVRAECAGLMYLCRSIALDHAVYSMCNVIDADVEVQDRPVGRGYMRVEPVASRTTPEEHCDAVSYNAHEFHHSRIVFDSPPDYAYRVTRGHGTDGQHDGVLVSNVIASYAHFRHTENTPWVDWFLAQLDGDSGSQDDWPATSGNISNKHV